MNVKAIEVFKSAKSTCSALRVHPFSSCLLKRRAKFFSELSLVLFPSRWNHDDHGDVSTKELWSWITTMVANLFWFTDRYPTCLTLYSTN